MRADSGQPHSVAHRIAGLWCAVRHDRRNVSDARFHRLPGQCSRRCGQSGRAGRGTAETRSTGLRPLSEAFDFVSSAAPTEHLAYLSLDTGAVYWVSELNPFDEEVPDDLESSDRYLVIPHKNDLDLGSRLALRFAEEELPGQYQIIERFFRSRDAYAGFKELLAAHGCLDKWFAFEAAATGTALRDWCAGNDVHVVRADDEG